MVANRGRARKGVLDQVRVSLVIGLLALTAACSGSDAEDPATASDEAGATDQEPAQQEPPENYAIDECLVGIWTTTYQRDQTTVNGSPLTLVDVRRQLSFAADGTEVATYLDTPAVIQAPSGEMIGQVTYSGELRYAVSTDQTGILSFQADGGQATATFDIGGQSSTYEVSGDSAPVTYTCSPTELTQNSEGYEGVFTRSSS